MLKQPRSSTPLLTTYPSLSYYVGAILITMTTFKQITVNTDTRPRFIWRLKGGAIEIKKIMNKCLLKNVKSSPRCGN